MFQSPSSQLLDLSRLATVLPHVPMIKFRAGLAGPSTAVEATPSPAPAVQDWWDVPAKFRRPRLDQAEVDLINSGGADLLHQ